MFQNALGQISSTSGIGFIDVTNLFKLNANAAFSYFQNALGIPNWSHQVAFKIGDLSAFGADGASLIKTYDLNGRTDASEITLDTRAVSRFYFDPTPANNSEWTMTPRTAVLAGGATVNVGRKGTAVAGGPADDRTDILTLMIHEIAHSLGMTDGSDRFITAVGGVDPSPDTGLTDDNFRSMVMPTSLTGYLQTYVLPFRASSSHVSTLAAGQTFAKAVTSEPGSGHGARALLADVEIHALGLVNGSFGCCPFKGEGAIPPAPLVGWFACLEEMS